MFTMLVVDDEYYLRLGFKKLFDWEKRGIEIIGEAVNGEEGLQMAIKYKPDLVITDIRMPFMDGLELMEKMKENHLDCNVIILSGYNEFEYAQKAIDNGALAYLLKPINKDVLCDTIEKVLKKIKEERSSKHYYEILKSELSSIKERLLKDILEGRIKDRLEIIAKLKNLDIPLESDNNTVVLIQIDDYLLLVQQLNREAQLLLKQQVEDCIAKTLLLNSSFIGIMLQMSPDKWCVILHLYENEAAGISKIKTCCAALTEEFKEKFAHIFSIGVSDICQDVESISAAFHEASEAAEIKFLPGINSVSYTDGNKIFNYRKEIREVIKYIKNNYYKDISVEMASKILYISPSYLMHIMRDELGKTFNECLTECRIEVAKELLKNPQNKIYEISQKVGYRDVKYFSRVFKKETGIIPTEYMRINTENA